MAAKRKRPLSADTNPKPRNTRTKKPTEIGPEDVAPPTMDLSESERLRIRTYMAEHRRFSLEATMRVLEKQALQRQLDPDNKLGLLDQAIQAASQAAAQAQEQHNEVLRSIEKRLNIEIKHFSFDAETGRLFRHQADAVPTTQKE